MTALDLVSELDPGRSATGIRHVPQTLDVFSTHFPLFPVLPGVLILEDLVEVARLVLAGVATGRDGSWDVASARRVRYRHFVQPGDSMEIEVVLSTLDGGTATFHGIVRVDGKPVTVVSELVLHLTEKGCAA